MNIVVGSSPFTERDIELLFGGESVITTDAANLTDLVAELGLFSSKSQARKAGRVGDIPKGWTEMKGNKKTHLWIWNPSE